MRTCPISSAIVLLVSVWRDDQHWARAVAHHPVSHAAKHRCRYVPCMVP
jgi:hypothetical protein